MLSNGAVMVNTCNLAAKVMANVAVWSILVYGLYFLVFFGDYTIGFEMSWLSLGKNCLDFCSGYEFLAHNKKSSNRCPPTEYQDHCSPVDFRFRCCVDPCGDFSCGFDSSHVWQGVDLPARRFRYELG